MSTKQLKILIAIMLGMILFLVGYGYGQAKWEWPLQAITETINVEEVDDVVKEEETIIYTFDMTKDRLVEKVNALVGNYDISRAIVNECTTQVPNNYEQCIKALIWVANAESSLFKNGMNPSQNPFGLMYKWKKRKFSSVEEAINVWVALYVKNNWGKRITWADWLKWKWAYCQSACTNWAKAYNTAVKKLEL